MSVILPLLIVAIIVLFIYHGTIEKPKPQIYPVRKDGIYLFQLNGKNNMGIYVVLTSILVFINDTKVFNYMIDNIIPIDGNMVSEMINATADLSLQDESISTYIKTGNGIKFQISGKQSETLYECVLTKDKLWCNVDLQYMDYQLHDIVKERVFANIKFNFIQRN